MFKKLKSFFKKTKKPDKKPAKELVEKPVPKLKKAKVAKPVAKKRPAKKLPVKKPSVKKRDARGAYKILKEPHVSEKANVITDQNKYIFKVYPRANKIETKKAVENVYGVKVKSVNIINVHKKQKVLRGIRGFKPGYKKAIVTLEKGEKIEIIPR